MKYYIILALSVFCFALQAQDSATVYYRLAAKKFDFDKHEEAERLVDKSILFKATDSAYILKHFLHYRNKSKSITYLDTAISINPSAANYVRRGNVKYDYANSWDTSSAIKDYDSAIQKDPQNADAYIKKAGLLGAVKEYDEAIEFYNKADTLKGLDSCHAQLRGFVYFKLGRYAEALRDFEIARKCDMYSEAILLSAPIAKCMVALGDTIGACRYILETCKVQGGVAETFQIFIKHCAHDNATVFYWQSKIDAYTRDKKSAMHSINRSIQLSPSDSAYIERARMQRETSKAIKDVDTAIFLNAKAASNYLARGTYKMDEDPKGAIKDFDKAISIDSTLASAYWLKANVYKDNGQYGKAMELYNEAIRFAPNQPMVYKLRGQLFQEMKKYREAIADYTIALQFKSPYKTLLYEYRSQCKEAIGDLAGACEDLSQKTGSYPDNSRMYIQKCDY